MRRYLYLLAALVFLGIHAVYTVRWVGEEGLLRVEDRARVSFARLVEDLRTARLVFVGELHNQPSHHEAQLRVIQSFHEADLPLAIGLEMFRADSQADLDRWVAGEMPFHAFLETYYENWSLPWAFYGEILTYARDHGIRLVGLNVPGEIVSTVARHGFDALDPDRLGKLPVVRCVVTEAYEDFIRQAMGMHGEDGPQFMNFCEAQLVWDTAMAIHLLDFVEVNPDHAVVVIAGSGHAWKQGIPAQVLQREEIPLRVVLPEIRGRVERSSVRLDDADYLWLGLPLRE